MIKVKNLTKYFWENKVLDNISFEVSKWQICWFIWENWAWKSTTMNILSTVILDYSWEVFIDSKLLSKNIDEARKIIGFMPDQYWLYDDMTLREYLTFFLLAYEKELDEKLIEKTLKDVFLLDKIDTPIWWLSRWMTQRICLARALILKPKILILDEPASWLDPKLRYELKKILLKLKNDWLTIFVSSHILSELWEYCDKIIFISNGKIVKDWKFEELKKEISKSKIFLITDNNEKSIKILKNLDFIKNIENKNSKLEIITEKNINTNLILDSLIKENIEIKEFITNSSSLEDVYMGIM